MTTTNNLRQRVERIEAAQPSNDGPDYVSFATADDLRRYLAQPSTAGRRITAFVGVSPDDWDAVEP